jgi:hypothetical protein
MKKLIDQAIADIKSKYSSPASTTPTAPQAATQETVMKPKTKPVLKPIATSKNKKPMKRVGYRGFVVDAISKGAANKVSVKQLTSAMKKKFPGKKDSYYHGWIFGMASWLSRNKKPCATLVRDHKVVAKAGKKGSAKDLLG